MEPTNPANDRESSGRRESKGRAPPRMPDLFDVTSPREATSVLERRAALAAEASRLRHVSAAGLHESIGAYAVVRRRGAGGFGTVYEVRGPAPEGLGPGGSAPAAGAAGEGVPQGHHYALKLVRSEWSARTGEATEVLNELATAALRPTHPNLMPVQACFRVRELPADAAAGRPLARYVPARLDELEVALRTVRAEGKGPAATVAEPVHAGTHMALVMPLAVADLHAMLHRWQQLEKLVLAAEPGNTGRRRVMLGVLRQARQRALLEVWRGLRALHSAGTLHGDVKPANALLVPAARGVFASMGDARVPTEAEAPTLDGLRARMRAIAGDSGDATWRLSDFGLAQRLDGAFRDRWPWLLYTSEYRPTALDCGAEGRPTAAADWYAYGVLAAETAFGLAGGPFDLKREPRVTAALTSQLRESTSAAAETAAAKADKVAAGAVFVDRLMPASPAFLRRLARPGSGDNDGRLGRCRRWLARDTAAVRRAEPSALDTPAQLQAAVRRLTGWGVSLFDRWRGDLWGPAAFDAVARFVLELLRPEPSERSIVGAHAALEGAREAADQAAAPRCPAPGEPGTLAAMDAPLHLVGGAGVPTPDVRFTMPDTQRLFVGVLARVLESPELQARWPIRDAAFRRVLVDTVAGIAAKLQQDVREEKSFAAFARVAGVNYWRGQLEDALNEHFRYAYWGLVLRPGPLPPASPLENACARPAPDAKRAGPVPARPAAHPGPVQARPAARPGPVPARPAARPVVDAKRKGPVSPRAIPRRGQWAPIAADVIDLYSGDNDDEDGGGVGNMPPPPPLPPPPPPPPPPPRQRPASPRQRPASPRQRPASPRQRPASPRQRPASPRRVDRSSPAAVRRVLPARRAAHAADRAIGAIYQRGAAR